jgi:hypothetical protein
MGIVNTNLKSAANHLYGFFKQAGFNPRGPDFTGSSGLINVPDINRSFDIRWEPHLNDAVILTLLHTPGPAQNSTVIAATEYLTKGMFDRCRSRGLSVLDENDNGVLKSPGFYYERYVDHQKKGRTKISGTPFSMKAARLVRAFLANPNRKWQQTELVKETGVTQGYASIKLNVLITEGYLVEAGGKLCLVDAERLLDDWALHYRFDRHQQHRFAFSAKSYDDGLRRLAGQLKKAGIEYAFTGWSASSMLAPYGIPQKWMTYVENLPDKPETLGLYPVEQGENALLIIPQDNGVFQFKQQIQGLNIVADPQVYIDLCKMPGRAKEQAQVFREKYLKTIEESNGQT